MAAMIFSGFCVLMFLLLMLCVVVQYNDPDGPVWMAIYGVPATLTAFAIFGKLTPFTFFVGVAYVGFGLYWMPDWRKVDRSIWKPHLEMMADAIEEAREAIGVFIAAGWMLVLGGAWYLENH